MPKSRPAGLGLARTMVSQSVALAHLAAATGSCNAEVRSVAEESSDRIVLGRGAAPLLGLMGRIGDRRARSHNPPLLDGGRCQPATRATPRRFSLKSHHRTRPVWDTYTQSSACCNRRRPEAPQGLRLSSLPLKPCPCSPPTGGTVIKTHDAIKPQTTSSLLSRGAGGAQAEFARRSGYR